MKATLGFLMLAALAAASFAQPSSPAISQVTFFFCNSNFTSCPLGIDPALAPIQLSDSNLYVPTTWAGQGNPNAGGTVFRTSIHGQDLVIHTFQPTTLRGGFQNGENPIIGFAQGTDGALYGVTEQGGANNGGVFYRLNRNGSFQVLYNFCSQSGCPDAPGSIILASDGNFYGAEFHTIFRLTPQGNWSLIHALDPNNEGAAVNLFQAADGNFYGAGAVGGGHGTHLPRYTGRPVHYPV